MRLPPSHDVKVSNLLSSPPLPIVEAYIVQPDGVGVLFDIAVHLVVHGYAVPTGGGRALLVVQGGLLAIERNCLKQELIVGSTLHLEGNVVPGFLLGLAGNAGRMPL